MKRNLLFLMVLILVAVFPVQSALAVAPSADDWADFKAAFDQAIDGLEADPDTAQGELANAQTIFDERFDLSDVHSSAKDRVRVAFGAAQSALSAGDRMGLAEQSEIAEKSALALIFTELEAALDAGRIEDANGWFAVMAAQLKLGQDHELTEQMNSLKSGTAAEGGATVIDGLALKLADKVAEELDEAVALADPDSPERDVAEARIKAAEGIGYFQAIAARVHNKIGLKDGSVVSGAVGSVYASLLDGDWELAAEHADIAKNELEEFAPHEEMSASAFDKGIADIQGILAAVRTETAAGNTEAAKHQAQDAWGAFVVVEPEIRRLDVNRYVAIEKIFPIIQEHPEVADVDELSNLFTEVAAVNSGEQDASQASISDTAITFFETWRHILFGLLALLGIYPIYLITKAFGWRHRAWRNIGIFMILLIIPVFMEALGRLGVEAKIETLQAFSFAVNEYAMLVWGLIMFTAFLFAINGLRAFCAQFGIEAIGVRQPEIDVPAPDSSDVETPVK